MKKLEVTPAQLSAIVEMKNDTKAMIGGGEMEVDDLWDKRVILIERMLAKNGLPKN